MGEKYLIWLDILGFDALAEEIAEKSGISERKVREDFVHLINEKVKEAEDRGEIIGKRYGEGEDWLLVTCSIDLVFKAITTILNHNTEYKHYEKVPLEIGIGVGQYDKWAKLDGSRLIAETSTIKFLKSRIIDYYREWYKRTRSRSIRSTFTVLTESAHSEMEPFDKEYCEKVEYESTEIHGKRIKVSFFVPETDKIIQRGLVLNFLEKIGKSASLWYRRIDRIFVPPNEYKDIIESLEKNKVVFLVGDPEIGKTYTAARIMWEYYCKGYNPIWHSGAEPRERTKVRQIMSECKLSEHRVTYFEDPFGKIRFEDREELRREIGNFLACSQRMDVRVIITSREEPFKIFEREKLSKSDLRELLKEMKLMKPSYNDEKKIMILMDWAREFDCKWLKNEELRTFMFDKGIKKLHTPLAMRDFALASRDCADQKKINALLEEKSKETKEAFAEEIAGLNKEKILFLSLLHILPMNVKKVEAIYYKICEKFGLDSEVNSFGNLQIWFKDKITCHREDVGFEFTHPSYKEGVIQCWNRNEVKNFLLRTINQLIKEDIPQVRGLVGYALIQDFESLSFKDEAISLVKVIYNDKSSITRYGVALGFDYYFDALPSSFALEFLKKISIDRHRGIRVKVLNIVKQHFKSIPRQESLELILNGLKDRAAWVRLAAVGCVRSNIEYLPEELVMKAIECCKELCSYTGWLISYFASITYTSFTREAQKLQGKYAIQD